MRVKHNKFDEVRMGVVQEALDRGNVAVTARKHGLSPYSVYKWVKQYRDEVEGTMPKKKQSNDQQSESLTAAELEQKLEQATKLIGEKELEIAILRELVKKKNPHIQFKWPENGS